MFQYIPLQNYINIILMIIIQNTIVRQYNLTIQENTRSTYARLSQGVYTPYPIVIAQPDFSKLTHHRHSSSPPNSPFFQNAALEQHPRARGPPSPARVSGTRHPAAEPSVIVSGAQSGRGAPATHSSRNYRGGAAAAFRQSKAPQQPGRPRARQRSGDLRGGELRGWRRRRCT